MMFDKLLNQVKASLFNYNDYQLKRIEASIKILFIQEFIAETFSSGKYCIS